MKDLTIGQRLIAGFALVLLTTLTQAPARPGAIIPFNDDKKGSFADF